MYQPYHTTTVYALPDPLSSLGHHPLKAWGRDLLYCSPFRAERVPSFHVDADDNIWYDFAGSTGGDVLDFCTAYLDSYGLAHTTGDVFRFLVGIEAGTFPQDVFNDRARSYVVRNAYVKECVDRTDVTVIRG